MTEMTILLLAVAGVLLVGWLATRYVAFLKSDGYGRRSTSGLPRNWKPTDWSAPDLPSTPYRVKPHF
ncbi:MAG: hypothetical protein ACRDO2_13480 [Nocardioidaceae bacterium]